MMKPIPILLEHAFQTTDLAIKTAKTMGQDKNIIANIGTAAFLHDLGKTTWNKELFYKAPILAHEWEIIKTHTLQGEKIILEYWPDVPKDILRLVRQHHERPGGRGYPDGIYELSLDTAILAACDVYTAMVSKRDYRKVKAFTCDVALVEVARFTPEQIVDALAKSAQLNLRTKQQDVCLL